MTEFSSIYSTKAKVEACTYGKMIMEKSSSALGPNPYSKYSELSSRKITSKRYYQ